ncbi:MAG: 2,4'-dihydroxyacetophenone dioxygenase family protein [Pseudomonadales bacterium]
MIPTTITHQDKLLTINTNNVPIIKDSIMPGVDTQPLFLDPQNGIWVLRVIFAPGVTLPKHFHTGTVHLWTMSGNWNYVEYPDQPQTAGCYLYEPGGSVHQFQTPASNTEGTDTFMIVTGCNVNFDDEGNFINIMDAGWIEEMINTMSQQQGHGQAKYIRATGANYSG